MCVCVWVCVGLCVVVYVFVCDLSDLVCVGIFYARVCV